MNNNVYNAPKTIRDFQDSQVKIVHPTFPQEKEQKISKRNPIEKAFSAIKLHLLDKLNIDDISKELTYIAICLSLFVFAGNGGVEIKNDSLFLVVLYTPLFAAIYIMAKASFKSILIGAICLVSGFYLNGHLQDFFWLMFIQKDQLNILTGLGIIFTSFSLIKS